MKLARRRRLSVFIPTASMGDIAFLLIIFFMVTSNFIKESHVNIDWAASRDVERLKESLISVSIDKASNVWLQGQSCEIQALEGAVRELVHGRSGEVVMLKVDKNVLHEKYGEVIMALSKAEVEIALAGELKR